MIKTESGCCCVCDQIKKFLQSRAHARLRRNVDTHENEWTELPQQVELPSKPNVILFSGSDDGSKWQLLCSLLHTTTKHLNRLGVILVYICSGGETTDDSSLRVGLR